jgi:hypothetical protein
VAGAGGASGPDGQQTTERLESGGVRRRGGLVGLLQLEEDLLAVHLDLARCGHADAHLVASDLEDGDDHVLADHDALLTATREDEHLVFLPWRPGPAQDRPGSAGAMEEREATREAGLLGGR